jgi:hypothetical protein
VRAIALLALLAAFVVFARAADSPVSLASRVRAPVFVAPEVALYRIEAEGRPAGRARFEYAPRGDLVELRADVERVAPGVFETQRSVWVFTRALELVRFEESLESRPPGERAPRERRVLRGEASGGVVRATFEIPGLPPRTIEAEIPPGALARYSAGLVLLEPENLVSGAVYTYRQLSPRSGRFATATTRVFEGPAPGLFLLETTSDEAPEVLVRTIAAPRSRERPNGAAIRSEQRLAGGKTISLVRVGD